FSGFPVAGDPHDQGEHESMCLGVERVQCMLVATGDGLDESDPDLLGYRHLRPVAIEHVAEGGLTVMPVLVRLSPPIHRPEACRPQTCGSRDEAFRGLIRCR